MFVETLTRRALLHGMARATVAMTGLMAAQPISLLGAGPPILAGHRTTGAQALADLAPVIRSKAASIGHASVAKAAGGLKTAALAHLAPVRLDALQFLQAGTGLATAPTGPTLGRIRLFGDMHFGFPVPARFAALLDDVLTLPRPDVVLTPGDEVHFGDESEYDLALHWFGKIGAPVHTVTGNHTFWNATFRHRERPDVLYRRWLTRFKRPLPDDWELGGVRFIGVGPTTEGRDTRQASLTREQVLQLQTLLLKRPNQPTVVVMHSPFHHTVLDDGVPSACYTSDNPGFFQLETALLCSVLALCPQVALIVTGHTHSPLHARGLVSQVRVGTRTVPHFNAMAIPFLRRITHHGPIGPQPLISWDMQVTHTDLVLHARDHMARRDVARLIVPLHVRGLTTRKLSSDVSLH